MENTLLESCWIDLGTLHEDDTEDKSAVKKLPKLKPYEEIYKNGDSNVPAELFDNPIRLKNGQTGKLRSIEVAARSTANGYLRDAQLLINITLTMNNGDYKLIGISGSYLDKDALTALSIGEWSYSDKSLNKIFTDTVEKLKSFYLDEDGHVVQIPTPKPTPKAGTAKSSSKTKSDSNNAEVATKPVALNSKNFKDWLAQSLDTVYVTVPARLEKWFKNLFGREPSNVVPDERKTANGDVMKRTISVKGYVRDDIEIPDEYKNQFKPDTREISNTELLLDILKSDKSIEVTKRN